MLNNKHNIQLFFYPGCKINFVQRKVEKVKVKGGKTYEIVYKNNLTNSLSYGKISEKG